MSFHLSLSTESVMAAYPDDPLIVAPDASVSEVLQLMRAQQTGSVLICSAGKMLGIFTDRDALRWMAKQTDSGNHGSEDQPISELMTREPTSLLATTSVGEAIQLMSAGRYRHLPIIGTNGMPSGMANVHGIVHYLVDHFPDTIYTLPPQPDMAQAEREGA
ncbi:CBS domain-containing protein [Bythopirellula goksoeyrii]|nr:CBS domain-containing protein [Bythopirellula goksoeyrii]